MCNKKIFILFLVLSFILFSIPGCTTQQKERSIQPQGGSTPSPSQESAPGGGITVRLSFPDGVPLLNQKAELICTLSSKYVLTSTTARIILPEGATLVGGNLEWQGNLKADTAISFSAQIIFKEIGKWFIEVNAKNVATPPGLWWGMDVIYLNVLFDHSEFGWPPTGPVPVHPVEAPSPLL